VTDAGAAGGLFGAPDDAEIIQSIHAVTSLGWSGPPRLPVVPSPPRRRYGWRKPSVRRFVAPRPGDAELSSVVASAYGGPGERPVPSAGALYPLRLLVVDLGDDALAERECPGWVALDPTERQALAAALFMSVAGPCNVVLLAGALESPTRRYGARAYRYLLLEAGHCAQEIVRASQVAGLASCPVGAFDDGAVSRLFRLEWSGEIPLYAVAIGRAARS